MKLSIYIITVLIFTVSCKNKSSDSEIIKNTTEAVKTNSINNLNIFPDCLFDIDTLKNENGYGCGSIFLYKEVEEGVLTVKLDPEILNLSASCSEFTIEKGIEINLEVYFNEKTYSDSIKAINFCSCTSWTNEQKRKKLKSLEGNIIISVKPVKYNTPSASLATARLTNLKFINELTDKNITIPEITFWNVHVGWYAG